MSGKGELFLWLIHLTFSQDGTHQQTEVPQREPFGCSPAVLSVEKTRLVARKNTVGGAFRLLFVGALTTGDMYLCTEILRMHLSGCNMIRSNIINPSRYIDLGTDYYLLRS